MTPTRDALGIPCVLRLRQHVSLRFHRWLPILIIVLLGCSYAAAQGAAPVRPVVTNNSAFSFPTTFGEDFQGVPNDNGDFVFIGSDDGSLFLRRAGTSAFVRIIQMGDAVPGFPNSHSDIIQPFPPRINSSGNVLFALDLGTTSGITQRGILLFDGTTLHKVISSTDSAPGAGGTPFGRGISFIGFDDGGDVSFVAPLAPSGLNIPTLPTLYIIPSGGSPVRIAGQGDAAPGIPGGTLTAITGISMNNAGQVLFKATIVGGPGGSALFVGSTAGVSKVVANGDTNPRGGTFGSITLAALNDSGKVTFVAGDSLWVNTPGTGAGTGLAAVLSTGTAAPVVVGGTYLAFPVQTPVYNNAGQIGFTAAINGGTNPLTTTGVFRFEPGSTPTVDVIGYRGEAIPGSLQTYNSFANLSMNQSGLASFAGSGSGGGIFINQQSGTNPPVTVVANGQATGTSLGGTFISVAPQKTLNSGATYFFANMSGGSAYFGEFLGTPAIAPQVLMSTADSLPAGAKAQLRTFRAGIAGNFIAFSAQLGGGKGGTFVENLSTSAISKVCEEGDSASIIGGGALGCFAPNFVNVNSSGTVVVPCTAIASPSSAVCAWTLAAGLVKLLATGDPEPVSVGGTISSAALATSFPPSIINDAGQIVISADGNSIYLMTVGGSPVKIVRVGDAAPGSGTFISVKNPAINASGQVAFLGTVTGGLTGIFIGSASSAPAKVVLQNDVAPGGGTFIAFSLPVINDSGTVAFNAMGTGGGTGVFTGTATAGPLAVALAGNAAPSGGLFNFSTSLPNVLINNLGDVAFFSPLTGGNSDSGFFVQRAADGVLRTVAIQGQAAPGTSFLFSTLNSTANDFPGEFFSLDPAGNVLIQGNVLSPDPTPLAGYFLFRTNNTLQRVILHGDSLPQSGGGTYDLGFQGTASGAAGQFAFFAEVGGGTFSDGIFLTQNPSPTLTSINPTSALEGQAVTPLTATGLDFVPGASLVFNGIPNVAAVSNNGTTLSANIPNSELPTGAVVMVTVVNPAPGGGTSNSVTFTIGNPAPTVTTLLPATALAGGPAFTLTVNGTNFLNSSLVTFNGVAKTVTFVNATQLTIPILATDISAAGTDAVIVTNPLPGGGPSNSVNFTINNLLPTVTSLSPASAVAGGAGFTLTVNGTNFVNGSTTTFNGNAKTATFISATQLTIPVLANDIAAASTPAVVITNPAPGGGTSNPVNLPVINPVPTITAVQPVSSIFGGAGFTLTVNGTNFVNGATVTFAGGNKATLFVSATQVTASILAGDIAAAGAAAVVVTNPAPGGGASNSVSFSINNPVPVLTSISPTTAPVGTAISPIIATGTGFVAGSTLIFNGTSHAGTVSNNGTTLTATIASSELTTAKSVSVVVAAPTPGGGISSSVSFAIDDFSVSGPASAVTVTAGQPANFSLNFGTQGGSLSTAVTFSASGLPTNTTATFSPASIQAGSASGATTLTIATTARTAAPPLFRNSPNFRLNTYPLTIMWLALFAMTFVLAEKLRRIRRNGMRLRGAVVLIAFCCALIVGCGSATTPGGNNGTPAGTSTITVTATAGSAVRTTTVILTVQ